MLLHYAWRRPPRSSRPVRSPRRPFPTLLELFEQDPDAGVRAHAGLALSQVAPADSAVVESCGRVLGRDADAHVRQAAAASLVQAGPASQAVRPALQRAMRDGDATVRVFAAAAVGQLGAPAARFAVPVSSAMTTSPCSTMRTTSNSGGSMNAGAPSMALS